MKTYTEYDANKEPERRNLTYEETQKQIRITSSWKRSSKDTAKAALNAIREQLASTPKVSLPKFRFSSISLQDDAEYVRLMLGPQKIEDALK